MTEAKIHLFEDSNTFTIAVIAFDKPRTSGQFVRILKGGGKKETLINIVQGLRDLASYIDVEIGDL